MAFTVGAFTYALGFAGAYGAWIAWQVSRPSYWRRLARDEKARWRRLPPAWTLEDADLRERVASAQAAREHLEQVLACLPRGLLPQAQSIRSAIEELEACAASAVRRARHLAAHERDRKELEAEIVRLREARTGNPAGIDPQEEALLAARERQLRALDEVSRARAGCLAGVARVTATLEALPPRLARLLVLQQDEIEDLWGSLDSIVGDINGTLDEAEGATRDRPSLPSAGLEDPPTPA